MKRFFFLSLIPIFLLVSCANKQSDIISFEENDTIKSVITSKEAEVTWSKELEGEILSEKIDSKEGVDSRVSLTPEVLSLIEPSEKKIYPSLPDFTLLDVSDMNKTVLKNITGFCDKFIANINKGPQQLFNQDYLFSYVFFKESLFENWNLMFDNNFPCTFEELNDSSRKIKLFDSYDIGKQKESFDFIEVPVRMYNKYGYADIIIYVERTTEYMINEIELTGWGRE